MLALGGFRTSRTQGIHVRMASGHSVTEMLASGWNALLTLPLESPLTSGASGASNAQDTQDAKNNFC